VSRRLPPRFLPALTQRFSPHTMLGEVLTHWTVRIALLCMAARFAGAMVWPQRREWFTWSRGVWTVGCIFFLLHVAFAFAFYHHWSHAHAFEVTARRTQEMLGVRFGEGIYFSYLFAILWTADVLSQWWAPTAARTRPGWLSGLLLSYLAFLAFNGAVVFERGITRTVGVPMTVLLLAGALVARWRARPVNPSPAAPATNTSPTSRTILQHKV
jgi:hypothetical protein